MVARTRQEVNRPARPYNPRVLYVILAAVSGLVVGATLSRTWTRRRAPRPEPGIGQLGPYTLEAKIGEGGMGDVFRGHHAMLRRKSAIKTLKPDQIDKEALLRFEQEVQLTSQLRHPNTVAVYDYGRTDDGTFYYAMEYLTGAPLDAIVTATGPFEEGRTIHVLAQACGSLTEAHGIRLIHRDIKPTNIVLCVRGGIYDWAKVLDFGLVKDVGGEDLDKLSSRAGYLLGTPRYMAPEGLVSEYRHDGRQDIYAIGCVAYYLLTGTHVFRGEEDREILLQHVKDKPEPPSQRAGRAIDPALEQLVLHCLEKRPEKRPPTAGAVAHALAQCPSAGSWTAKDAQAWWITHESALSLPEPLPHGESSAGFFGLS